jgi:hypothetical protein
MLYPLRLYIRSAIYICSSKEDLDPQVEWNNDQSVVSWEVTSYR